MSRSTSLSLYAFAFVALIGFLLFSSYTGEKSTAKLKISNTDFSGKIPQIVEAIPLDKPFSFAGESVPMENFDIRERLDLELLRNAYWHSNTILSIKRAKRFFPTMERILAEQGIPDDFKYLAVAESNLSNAVSPAGAKGIWQFMKGTGKEYGLEVDNEVDERYHLEKATYAACKYLKSLKKKFGSWTMAAAAYNVGGNKLNKESALQRSESYYDLNLNQETARYVFRILAIKEILSDHKAYGFMIEESEKYQPLDQYNEVKINGAVANWGDFAKENGVSYRMLKVYNPWLITSSLTNKGKTTYTIRLPK
jgi:hypothetical protein